MMNKEKTGSTNKPLKEQIITPASIKKLIYVGPTMAGLKTLTSFTGGLPAEAQALISRDPKYNRLFVPVSGFVKAIKDVKEGGLKEIYSSAARERF